MEFTGSPFSIKSLNDSGHIEGLLAGFGDVDQGGDKLVMGCLSKSLATRTTPLPMLLHHRLDQPIGAWKEWNERPEGLYVKGNLTLSTPDAQNAYALAKDGALTGLSIGWKPLKGNTDAQGVRVITEAELFEGSLVSVPMNDRTRVAMVKGQMDARYIAEFLQEAGISGRRSKLAAGAAWKVINQSDEDEADAQAAAILNAAAARIAAIGGTK